jgi:hypothetical protein
LISFAGSAQINDIDPVFGGEPKPMQIRRNLGVIGGFITVQTGEAAAK